MLKTAAAPKPRQPSFPPSPFPDTIGELDELCLLISSNFLFSFAPTTVDCLETDSATHSPSSFSPNFFYCSARPLLPIAHSRQSFFPTHRCSLPVLISPLSFSRCRRFKPFFFPPPTASFPSFLRQEPWTRREPLITVRVRPQVTCDFNFFPPPITPAPLS